MKTQLNLNNMQCSKCNSEAKFKQGIKKETGKPWSGYFCQNPDCKNVDWKPIASPKPQNAPTSDLTKNGDKILVDEVVALIGEVKELIELIKKMI